MEIKKLAENINVEIKRLRETRSVLDDSISRQTAIIGEDGRVSGFRMNPIARKKISDAQIERWKRVQSSKLVKK